MCERYIDSSEIYMVTRLLPIQKLIQVADRGEERKDSAFTSTLPAPGIVVTSLDKLFTIAARDPRNEDRHPG